MTDTSAFSAITEPDATAGTPEVQWAPAPPPRRRGRRALAIGVPVAVVAAAAVTASLVLIAPGTAVAGVPVGFQTAGMAGDTLSARLNAVSVTIGEGGPTLTAADLGASVDAERLAQSAYDTHPLWRVDSWFADAVPAEVTLDAAQATAALRAALPDLYVDPTPAGIRFDGESYVVTPAVDGEGIDLAVVHDAVERAFTTGAERVVLDAEPTAVPSVTTTAMAEETAATLNAMLADIGFYADDENVLPIDAKTAASWLEIGTDADGAFTIAADSEAIQAVVDTLPGVVNRDAVNAVNIVNRAGEVLREDPAGQTGLRLGDTSGVAADFAARLAAGEARYPLTVDVTPFETTTKAREIEVDLSEQRIYLRENDTVVDSWLISSGRVGAETFQGRYSVGWKISKQDMRGTSRDTGTAYTQPDVPWVMYFNGNQAFHGAYWHNNFGNRMSAGCVNMPPAKAKALYDWTPPGTDVWIHG